MLSYCGSDRKLANDLPRSVLPFCQHFGSIVAWVTLNKVNNYISDVSNVMCGGKVNGKKCYNYVIAGINDDGIVWFECDKCGSFGYINNWEMTEWDRRKI